MKKLLESDAGLEQQLFAAVNAMRKETEGLSADEMRIWVSKNPKKLA